VHRRALAPWALIAVADVTKDRQRWYADERVTVMTPAGDRRHHTTAKTGVLAGAWRDLSAAVAMRHLWVALANEDIGDQHRNTLLGPLWMLINYLAFAATFIFVFHVGAGDSSYAAYVATGLLVWFYVMEAISQGVSLFRREESFIKGTNLPLFVYAMRLTVQSVIRGGYALLGCIIILLASGAALNAGLLWAMLGIAVIIVMTPPLIMILAFVGAYVPDSQFIIANAMRLGMFLTPVFWVYEGAGGVRHALYHWNPFTYLIEVVRTPILTGSPPVQAFAVCLAIALGLWGAALLLTGKLRKQLVFVL